MLNSFVCVCGGLRCNSKASYLPRQSLEKTNPDHGRYKLTLNSNEAVVNSTTSTASYDIIVAGDKGKLTNNLPDVLPVGAKLQQQQQPIICEKLAPLQYSFSSNNKLTSQNAAYPLQHRYSSPTMDSSSCSSAYSSNSSNDKTNQNNSKVNNSNILTPASYYARSQSCDAYNESLSNNRSPRFKSQSTIDLKSHKTYALDTTYEDEQPRSSLESLRAVLSPAQSESNINVTCRSKSNSNSNTALDASNNESAQRSGTEDGQIVRAELVSTTLPPVSSAATASGQKNLNKAVIRKDSLRENIEKITQLQCKLMSAHIHDNGFSLTSFGSKPLTLSNTSITEISEYAQAEEAAEKVTEDLNAANLETEHLTNNLDRQNSPSTIANDTHTLTLLESTSPKEESKATTEHLETATQVTSTLLPSPLAEANNDENSLKFMQRSEIVLRVNPAMVEASSQTDDLNDDDTAMLRLAWPHQYAKENQATRTTLHPRQCHPIELDCEKMCKELAALLPNNDKLVAIILPQSPKTAADYVNNLYNPNIHLRPTKHDVGTSTLMRIKLKDRGQIDNNWTELDLTTFTNEEGNEDCDIMKRKVKELIKHLKQKIRVLGNEQIMIEEESTMNEVHGSDLLKKFADKVRPIEATKFRTYVDDVGHITSLLLSLSERLARAENSLFAMDDSCLEKKSLESKRDRLLEQLDEARRLKSDIDRRGKGLSDMIERNLNADDFADFDYFINMKAKLITDSRNISDKIKSSQELLNALSETLVTSDC